MTAPDYETIIVEKKGQVDWVTLNRPESLNAINYMTGPTGLFLNFSDGYRYRSPQPVSYWFARRLDDPGLLRAFFDVIQDLNREGLLLAADALLQFSPQRRLGR